MATPNSDDGVPVNLENGGGCGGGGSEVPGCQNADKVTAKAKKKSREQGCSSNSHAVSTSDPIPSPFFQCSDPPLILLFCSSSKASLAIPH
jgi:hypothetical protein